jgi:hypothetical protein
MDKLKNILGIKFSDNNTINDGHIFSKIDFNKDKKLSVDEIKKLADMIKLTATTTTSATPVSGTSTPPSTTNTNADISQDITTKIPQEIPDWLQSLLKQPMQQPIFMMIPFPMQNEGQTMSGMMPRMPYANGYQSMMGPIRAPQSMMNTGRGRNMGESGFNPSSFIANPQSLSEFLGRQ